MGFFVNLLLLILEIWLLAGMVLALHRFSTKIGLAPLYVFMGGMTAVLQSQSLGWMRVNLGTISLAIDSHALLPVLLFGLLIIYVINGTNQARRVLIGMVLVTITVAVLQAILAKQAGLPESIVSVETPPGYSPRILIASIIALMVDLILLILIYQASSNIQKRFPSQLAGGLALLAALWSDALVFPSFAFGGRAAFGMDLVSHLAGKSLAGVVLMPLLAIYLKRAGLDYPETTATTRRPTLDFFTNPLGIELREQQDIFQTATETMQDGFIIADLDGSIVYANSIVTRIAGIPLEELIDQNLATLLSKEQAAGFPDMLDRLLERSTLSLEVDFHSRNGRTHTLSVNTSLVHNESGQPHHFVATIRDITRQRRYERQLLTLNRSTADLVQIRDIETLLNRILETSIDLFRADASSIYLVDSETKQVTHIRAKNLPGEFLQRLDHVCEHLQTESVWRTSEPVYVKDTLEDSTADEDIRFIADHDIRSFLMLPILDQDDQIGALCVLYREPRSFSKNEIQFGMTLTQTLAITVQNAALYHAERDQRKLAEALVRAGILLNSSLNLEDVMDEILQQAMRVVPCRAANVMVIDDEQVSVIRSRGYEDISGALQVANDPKRLLSFPIIKNLLATQKPIYIPDTAQHDQWQAASDTEWIRSYAGIPLVADQEVIGILHASSETPEKFTSEMVANLVSFASHAATAIKNARSYQAEQEQRELSDALTRAAAALNTSLDLEVVLDQILVQIMRVVSCRAANIQMIDTENEHSYVRRHRGYENMPGYTESVPHVKFPLAIHNIAQMLAGEPVLIPDTRLDRNWDVIPGGEWIKSYVGVPIQVEEKVVGFLNIDSDIENFFTSKTVQQLQAFADHASAAIKNAELYADISQQASEMAALATSAASISTSLKTDEVIYIVAEQMCRTLKVQACAVSKYEPDTNALALIAEYSPEGWYIGDEWLAPMDLDHYPLSSQVLRTNAPFQLRIGDIDPDDPEHQFMLQADIKSFLMLPLVVQEQPIGLIELIDDEVERVFSEHEILLGQTLASHAASAIQNANLYQQLQVHAAELETRVDQRTAELRAAKEHIETILASVPDAVFVLDEKGALFQANQAGKELLRQAEDAQQDIFAPEFLEMLAVDDIIQAPAILEVNDRAYQARSSVIELEEGSPSGQVIIFWDVTRFRELDQLKSQFISDVSHELRTPLTNMTLFLGLLGKEDNIGKRTTYQDILQRETKRLTHLIEDLLNFSRIELGRTEGKVRPMDVNQIVHQLTVDRALFAAKNEIRLTYFPQIDLPPALGDPNWLTQALSNLLTNAINYTSEGGKVTLQTRLETRQRRNWVAIKVIDTGVGIAPQEAPKIFDRFYRGSASQKTGASGTGLGLAISKELVTKMGGDISLKTIQGEGSTFTIWLRPAATAVL